MNTALIQLFARRLTADAFDVRLAQTVCWSGGCVTLVLTTWKLTALELTEAQFLFGLLLAGCTALLLVLIGLVVPLTLQHPSHEKRGPIL